MATHKQAVIGATGFMWVDRIKLSVRGQQAEAWQLCLRQVEARQMRVAYGLQATIAARAGAAISSQAAG